MLFSKKHKSKQKFLKLGGKFIKHETEVKYLGVTLDKRLSWRSHINEKINTCKTMLLNITNKYRHTHKAKPKLMKWIYTVNYIEKHINSGREVLGVEGAAAYQLGNTSSRTITEVKQR